MAENQGSIMDYESRAQYVSTNYKDVILTDNIKGNGRDKLLLIGKTGAGKSSVKFLLLVILFYSI